MLSLPPVIMRCSIRWPGETANALLLSRADSLPACMKDEPPQAEWAATAGFMERATVGLWKIPASCLEGANHGP